MSQTIAVLRPEPGNGATVARVRAAGFSAISLPLFTIQALDWSVPGASADYDGLLLTSANTIRFGGEGLATLRHLPTFAVGDATANLARAAGFDVVTTGDNDAASLMKLAERQGYFRMLHLGGRDRSIGVGEIVAAAIAVYASHECPITHEQVRSVEGTVALLHSARAARRFAKLVDDSKVHRHEVSVAAISDLVAATAGDGWLAVAVATGPRDESLIEAVRSLID